VLSAAPQGVRGDKLLLLLLLQEAETAEAA